MPGFPKLPTFRRQDPGSLSNTGWLQATDGGVKTMRIWKAWLAALTIGCLEILPMLARLRWSARTQPTSYGEVSP